MRAKFMVVVLFLCAIGTVGCLGIQKRRHAPNDENLRYIYITVYPDECALMLTIEFKDSTPTFRDTHTTHIHEPISYSIDQTKVKRIHVTVKRRGWVTEEREWIDQVPFDVFIKLNTVR